MTLTSKSNFVFLFFFFVIAKFVYGQFCNLTSLKIIIKWLLTRTMHVWVTLCSSDGACRVARWLNTAFHSGVWIILMLPLLWGVVCCRWPSISTQRDFSLSLFFLLNFHACLFKISKQPFNLIFIHIWFMLFWLSFILF